MPARTKKKKRRTYVKSGRYKNKRPRKIKRPTAARAANKFAIEKLLVVKLSAPTPEMVKGLRRVLGLSQPALGDQLGATALGVSQWETGRRIPNPKFTALLHQLAEMNRLDFDRLNEPAYVKEQAEVRVFVEHSVEQIDAVTKEINA